MLKLSLNLFFVLGLSLPPGLNQIGSEAGPVRLATQELPEVKEPLRYLQLSGFRATDLVALQGIGPDDTSRILSGVIRESGIAPQSEAVRFFFDKAKRALALIRDSEVQEDVVIVATLPIFKPAQSVPKETEIVGVLEYEGGDVLEQTLVTTTDGTPAKLTLFPFNDDLMLYSGGISFGRDWMAVVSQIASTGPN